MLLNFIKKLYRLIYIRNTSYKVGEVILTEDNGYVKILSVYKVGRWYDKRVITNVKIINGKYAKFDVYYTTKGFTKLPKDDIVRLLYE